MNKISKIIGILPLFSVVFCSCNTTTKTDYESYQDILKECIEASDFHTQLYIFAESIEGLEIKKFCFSNTEILFTGDWLMYLVIRWDEAGFNNELSRLDQVKSSFSNGKEKPIIKYEEQSLYLTINKDNRYEYALYESETHEIVYVSNQLYLWDDIPVEKEHILPSVTIPSEFDDGDNSYNMYYYYEGDIGMEVTE